MRASKLLACVLLVPTVALAATESDWPTKPFEPNSQDYPSLQRGFTLYVNYCLGCHSLKFQRYERTADDLELPHGIVLENLIFSDAKIGSLITNAMPEQPSRAWFGVEPPDLTLITKAREPGYVHNYLNAFYADDSRPFGVNNKMFPNVAMPHALLELQGVPVPACHQVPKHAPNGGEMRDPLVPGKSITEEQCNFIDVVEGTGKLTPAEYQQATYDIANFLYYVAEPARHDRMRLGVYVLLFLVVLYVFTALLGREYGKEIH
jgi:cytochrome c1